MTALILHCFGPTRARELNRKTFLSPQAHERARAKEREWKRRYDEATRIAGGDLGKDGSGPLNAPKLRT